MLYAVSACLLGENCKYSGGNNAHAGVMAWMEGHPHLRICPEWAGGLPCPREPSEIIGGTGQDVWEGKARVQGRQGRDVTKAFREGAEISLREVRRVCEALRREDFPEGETPEICAVLKARSPSCGVGQIYDGTFSGTLTPGDGVTAALFRQEGIRVMTEEDFEGDLST